MGKRIFLFSLLFIFSIAINTGVIAKTEIIRLKKKVFKNDHICKSNQTCDLKEVNFEFSDYRLKSPSIGLIFGSRLFSSYKTKKIENLDKYVFVQFIQGCTFRSTKDTKQIKDVRKFYGNYIKFKHSKMTIDSIDTDPVYNSAQDQNLERHYYYRWNTRKDSYNVKTEEKYGVLKPTTPRLYVVDHPGGGVARAFNNQKNKLEAKNLSFKLKTCLYKNEDVPIYLNPLNDSIEKSIVCYSWNSSFIFNHLTKQFETKEEIDPICL